MFALSRHSRGPYHYVGVSARHYSKPIDNRDGTTRAWSIASQSWGSPPTSKEIQAIRNKVAQISRDPTISQGCKDDLTNVCSQLAKVSETVKKMERDAHTAEVLRESEEIRELALDALRILRDCTRPSKGDGYLNTEKLSEFFFNAAKEGRISHEIPVLGPNCTLEEAEICCSGEWRLKENYELLHKGELEGRLILPPNMS